jgi:hypothetical protein
VIPSGTGTCTVVVVTVTVTTGDEAVQGNIEIKSLPLIFESEEKF